MKKLKLILKQIKLTLLGFGLLLTIPVIFVFIVAFDIGFLSRVAEWSFLLGLRLF